MLYEYANGLDSSPVSRYSEREKIKSVGNGTTFRRNLQGMDDIKVAVTALSDTVASRLRGLSDERVWCKSGYQGPGV